MKKRYLVIGAVVIIFLGALSLGIYNFTKGKKAKTPSKKQNIVEVVMGKIQQAEKKTKEMKEKKEKNKIAKLEKEIKKKNNEIKRHREDIKKAKEKVLLAQNDLIKNEMDFQKEIDKFKKLKKEQNESVKKLQIETKAKEEKKEIEEIPEEKLYKLTKTYESMPPEQAADILNNLEDDDLLIKIINRMKDANRARVLAAMEPKRAARISKMIVRVQKSEIFPEGINLPKEEVIYSTSP